jgi:hypothetical protein
MTDEKMPWFRKKLMQAINYALTGSFFAPGEPMKGQNQETAGRRYDYPSNYNQNIRPRRESGITFETLRAFSKAYDLLRIVIETRKDQVCAFDWSISPTEENKDSETHKAACKKIQEFFQKPATDMDWDGWLRSIMEDCFVLDAIALWPTYEGKALHAIEIIDPATIKPVIDESGRRPDPPYPAYQQILKGVVANEYRKGELYYFIRNPMSNTVFGYSHVEQIIMTVNIGLRREKTQLDYFTEGNIPEAIAGVPETWTPEQISFFQKYWDQITTGTENRIGKLKFVPNDATKIQMLRTDEATLKGEFDEWLMRIICYTFSVSPIPFIKQTNRSVAESMDTVAKEEGLLPLLNYVKRIVDRVIREAMRIEGIEFKWMLREDVEPKTQNEIDMEELEHGVISIDDIRARKGLKPLGIEPMIWTNSGPVPVSMFLDGTAPSMQPAQPSQEFDENGDPIEPAAGPPDKKEARKRIAGPFRYGQGSPKVLKADFGSRRQARLTRDPESN